jgi:hypothetical protein
MVTEGRRRRHSTVGDVEVVLGSVRARKMVHSSVQATSSSGETEADVVDELIIYRAPASDWSCLVGSWYHGDTG